MGKIVKEACILFAITLVAGILLGVVYQVTKEPIEKANYEKQQKAYKEVLADAETFKDIDNAEDFIKNINEKLSADETLAADSIESAVLGLDASGKTVGYVFTVVAGGGYSGDIKFSVGISADGNYAGTSILSISETPGLGMRAQSDPSYLNQFKGAPASEFKLVKDGSGSAEKDNTIDAISGSTITSKCILNGINAAMKAFAEIN